MRQARQLTSDRAMTLVELLIVVGIVAVLAGLILPVLARGRVSAHTVACASNQRQVGAAFLQYAAENGGLLPPTTHTTGSRRIDESWIYALHDFLPEFDRVRVCPADPAERREQVLKYKATSYVLNELVFDQEEHNHLQRLPKLQDTLLMFVLTENRRPNPTWDHAHTSEWSTYTRALQDIEPDRHRLGSRAPDRLKGSSNYLYADMHVENLTAVEFKRLFENGRNPAAVPTE